MHKLIMIVSIALIMGAIPVQQAHAGKDSKNPCENKEYMEMHKQRSEMKQRARALMNEGMDMWLEAVTLLKESAPNPALKKKAAALEKRMRANVNEHKELHKTMHNMRKEHGGKHGDYKKHGNPCAPRNPCGQKSM